MAEPGVHDGPDGDMMEAAEAAVMKAAQGVGTAMANFAQAMNNWQQVFRLKRREAERQSAALVNTKIQEVRKWVDKRTESLVKTYFEEEKKKSSNVGNQKTSSVPPVASHQSRTAVQGRQLPPEEAGTSSPAKRSRTSLTDSSSYSATPTPQQQTAPGNVGQHFLAPDPQTPSGPPFPHSSVSMPTSSEPTPARYDEIQQSLLRAVKNARANDVKTFLKLKVNPDIKDKNGDTLLHIAVNNAKIKERENTTAKILEGLIDCGNLSVDAKNYDGQTPLHVAASIPNGDSCANFLLIFNANVNATDNKGETPLHCAARSGNEKIAKKLVLRGASLEVQNYEGNTPIDVAKDDNMRRSLLQVKLSPSAEETLYPSSFLEVDLNEDNFEGNEMSP